MISALTIDSSATLADVIAESLIFADVTALFAISDATTPVNDAPLPENDVAVIVPLKFEVTTLESIENVVPFRSNPVPFV